jgi:hypothetical protein
MAATGSGSIGAADKETEKNGWILQSLVDQGPSGLIEFPHYCAQIPEIMGTTKGCIRALDPARTGGRAPCPVMTPI